MKPAAFEYLAPVTLEEALAIKAEHGDEVKPLAGGQSLIPAMNFRIAQPAILVDLNKIDELSFLRRENGELRIGAMARQSQVEKNDLVATHSPLLAETMPHIAHPQIRNRGTFGGSLAHADPAAELPVTALALNVRMKVQNSKGERWIPIEDFFLGFFTTAMEPDEILTEVAVPDLPPRTGWSFLEIARRSGDYAMAGVAATITLDKSGKCKKARLVCLNVGDGPIDGVGAAALMAGENVTPQVIEAAAEKVTQEEIMPFGNVHASIEYQQHLSRVLVQRALTQAHERAAATLEAK